MFFDGFKAMTAIGGLNPNGITMDKNERLGRLIVVSKFKNGESSFRSNDTGWRKVKSSQTGA